MNKWKMNRAGLLNFWYYDEEVFSFDDGKLLLRGSNGSGKSVTMQSFLPVLLDGKKSPDRLDPFGSKARRMEDYLLGEKEIVNRDERTGYLFLEFKRKETDQYMTIGIGLQAKRNKQMKFWGFVITDNRRIGKTIELYKHEKHAGEQQKIPRSRIELENVIGEGGQVVQTQNEYMKLVNKYIFGFETIEAYEDLIKLLIQLRSPKLSKDFRPTVIYEILEASLPPLTDDDLRHLSDTIEQMDQTKQQIEQLERELEAIKNLNRVYSTYNERILADHANELLSTTRKVSKEEKLYKELVEETQSLDQDITQLKVENLELNQQQEIYEKKQQRLQSHKVWNLEKERKEEQEKLDELAKDLSNKEQQLSQRRKKEIELQDRKNQLEEKIEERKSTMNDWLINMDNDAMDVSFQNHDLNKQDFERHVQDTFDFSIWRKETNDHIHALEEMEASFQKFEQLKQKYMEKDKELANETKKLDDKNHEEVEWLRLFTEDKEKKLDEIYQWVEASEWLEVGEHTLQEVTRSLNTLYEPTKYETIVAPFRESFQNYEEQKRKALSELIFNQDTLSSIIAEKENELQEWKQKKDPEPPIQPATKMAREKLMDKGVATIPFYAAVEFQDDVEEDVRKRIEAAMMDSGILDALITSEKVNIEHDRVLVPEPNMMAHTLADYLKPDLDGESTIPASLIDEVLRSILITEDNSSTFSISEDGHYQLGLLQGHAVPVENVRYIGRSARKRFREEQISLLQDEINQLMEEKDAVENNIRMVEKEIEYAKSTLERFPDDVDLQESFEQIRKVRLEMNFLKEQVQRLSEEVKAIHVEFSKVKHLIDEKTRIFNIEKNHGAYKTAITITRRYEKDLSELEKEHINYVNDVKRQLELDERLVELEEELLEWKGDINILTDRVERLRQNIKQIEIQLDQEGVGNIRKQIAEVQQQLHEIGELLDKNKSTLPRKEADREHLDARLEEKVQQLDFWKNMKGIWATTFTDELKRGFVQEFDEGKEVKENAREVVTQYGELLKEKDSSKLSSQLTSEYYKQQSDLMEYRMSSFDSTVQVPDWMKEVTSDEQLPIIENWKQKTVRRLIELNDQGKQVSPFTVQSQLELDQARQESLLDEQDQALYEEILFKSVGTKLRARIRRAEQWAEKMNGLMETRDTSSGLSFSIKWKPRTADSEMEMDTVDLVRLLKQDAKLLKEEDLEKITVHFRSKISKAKELMNDSSEIQTLLQVLKEVLDYRKWFSFVLYFKREGEVKRELTNNQFYKFSGGEKAMAMYIPLFTACYSRYLEAETHAPYIISLDEAFAGVDENNIREMFEIVEHLGFDYIMNSQVLWGDYDTISELSICELVRPKNADFVSVIRYHWDGNRMNLELPEAEIDETLV